LITCGYLASKGIFCAQSAKVWQSESSPPEKTTKLPAKLQLLLFPELIKVLLLDIFVLFFSFFFLFLLTVNGVQL